MKKKSKKVGLALGSGGSRGFSHIGVIKALVENDIPIDLIAGASAGSVIGSMYAKNKDIYEVINFWESMDYLNIMRTYADPSLKSGFIRGQKLEEFLEKYFNGKKIQNLALPFQAVTTDFNTGDKYLFKKGHTTKAVRASSSIPVFFQPCEYGRRILVDGGACEPVPVATVKDMGADMVIAINLDSILLPDPPASDSREKKSNMAQIARDSVNILRYNLAKSNCIISDITIEPRVPFSFFGGFSKIKEIIEIGEKATLQKISEIQELINS